MSGFRSRGFRVPVSFVNLCLVLASLAILVFPSRMRAQAQTGRISGAVTDQSGGAVAGATVTVTDAARGLARPLTTDAAGQYAAPNLTPGIYTTRAEYKGFKTVERQNIQVDVGGDIRVDLTLQPGEQTQTVTVTEALPVINTTNAETGQTLENNLVANLPLLGRNFARLTTFVPGTFLSPGAGNGNGGSTYGTGSQAGAFMVDGLYEMVAFSEEANVGGGTAEAGDATVLPLDAIQEVNVVANPKAEYGWTPGLTASVGLKSGTNTIHGSAYAFGRDQDLDAKNAFVAARSPVEFEQWGASLGGPIKKNKLFYMLGYESVRESIPATFTENAPTTAHFATASSNCQGGVVGNCGSSFPDAIAAMNAAHQPLNVLSLNLAGCNAKSPNIGSISPTTVALACTGNQYGAPSLFNNFSSTSTNVTNTFQNHGGSDNGLAKVDYHINDQHALNASFFYGRYLEYAFPNTTVVTQPYWQDILGVTSKMVRGVEIWTPNSSFLNEARVGFDSGYRPVVRAECAANGDVSNPLSLVALGAEPGHDGGPVYSTSYGLTSGPGAPACGIPTTTISGFTGQLGFANNRDDSDTDIQGADSLSYAHGTHQFKFGVDVRAEGITGTKVLDVQTGEIGFGATNIAAFTGATPLESFLAGVPSSESIKPGNPIRHVSWYQIAGFAQDDWRILPRLTLNLGFRLEIQTPFRDANELLGNFAPGTPTGMVQNNEVWSTQIDPEPRLGVVWDVTGKGTTVLRAGAGISFETPQILGLMSVQNDDYSSVPTGATLYNANGSTIQGPGNINNSLVTTAPITSGGVAVGNFIPWGDHVTLFPNTSEQCGNGLAPVSPVAGAPTVNPGTCIGYGGNPNLKFDQVLTWNLAFQRALTNTLSFDADYIGTHSWDNMDNLDSNEPAPGQSGATNELGRRPYESQYPWFSKVELLENVGDSNFDAFVLGLVDRAYRGLTFRANYTLAHALGYPGAGSLETIMNSGDPRADYGNLAVDARNHVTLAVTYALPGRKSWGQLLEGWTVNSAVNAFSATPLTVIDSSFDTSGTGEKLDRWNLSGPATPFDQILGGAGLAPCFGLSSSKLVTASSSPCIVVAAGSGAKGSPSFVANMPAACVAAAESGSTSNGGLWNVSSNAAVPTSDPGYNGLAQLASIGCYYSNGSAIIPPAQGTFGTMPVNDLRGKGFESWDASVIKDWKIKERLTMEFRAEVFNLLNRTQYSSVGVNLSAPSTFGLAQSTTDVSHGNPVVGAGGPRTAQFGLKFLF